MKPVMSPPSTSPLLMNATGETPQRKACPVSPELDLEAIKRDLESDYILANHGLTKIREHGWRLVEAVEQLQRDLLCEEQDQVKLVDDRDRAQERLDRFVEQVARLTGRDFGEHSNANDPVVLALEALAGLVPLWERYDLQSWDELLAERDQLLEVLRDRTSDPDEPIRCAVVAIRQAQGSAPMQSAPAEQQDPCPAIHRPDKDMKGFYVCTLTRHHEGDHTAADGRVRWPRGAHPLRDEPPVDASLDRDLTAQPDLEEIQDR